MLAGTPKKSPSGALSSGGYDFEPDVIMLPGGKAPPGYVRIGDELYRTWAVVGVALAVAVGVVLVVRHGR